MRTVLAFLLATTVPAHAAVTPAELWTALQRGALSLGTPLTAEVQRSGSDLVLLRPTLDLGTVGEPLPLRIDRVELRQNPDGSVRIVLPDRFPITLDLPDSPLATDPDQLAFLAAAPGLEIAVDDLGETAAFRILAPSLSVTLDPSSFDGVEKASLNLALADLRLDHRQDLAYSDAQLQTDLSLGTLHVDGSITVDKSEGGTFSLDLSALDGRVFIDIDPSRLQDRLATLQELVSSMDPGQAIRGSVDHGPIAFQMTLADDQPGPRDIRLTVADGQAAVNLDRTGFVAEFAQSDTSLSALIEDPDVPFRDFGMDQDRLALGLTFGIPGPTGPEDYAVSARIEGLGFSDPVWGALDASGALPRDPVTVAIALSGQFNEKPRTEVIEFGEAAPVDILSMSLDDLRLSGLGVDLTGTGGLTFDNSDLETFDGAPAPDGAVSFTATGINALLDRLVEAGLVPRQDLGGIRLGLAFIAKTSANPDTLTTQIEFRDKALYLNGVKLR